MAILKKIIVAAGLFFLPSLCFASTFVINETNTNEWIKGDQATFAGAHDASTADAMEGGNNGRVQNTKFDSLYYIRRIGYEFPTDLTSLPSGYVIDSVEFHIYPTSIAHADSESVSIVGFTPTDPASWANGDFSHFGTTKYATDAALASLTASTDNTMMLNSTGIAALQTGASQNTYIGIRTSGDVGNTAPTGSNEYTQISTHYSYMVVNYHVPTSSSSSAPASSAASSASTGTGAYTGSGSLPIFHTHCAGFDILSGTSSGSAFTFDSCTSYDTTIEIPALRSLFRQFGLIIYSGIVLIVRWMIGILLIYLLARGMFNIVTRKQPPVFRIRRL